MQSSPVSAIESARTGRIYDLFCESRRASRSHDWIACRRLWDRLAGLRHHLPNSNTFQRLQIVLLNVFDRHLPSELVFPDPQHHYHDELTPYERINSERSFTSYGQSFFH